MVRLSVSAGVHTVTGQEVEVGNDDEGFQGSWYAAKVVQTPLMKEKKVLVEFITLMEDVQSSKALQEYVDISFVRPRPPQDKERCFELGELVEAFHNDGWWEGTITQIHDNLKYSVNLGASVEELEFQQAEIRSHQQWIGGRWVGAQELVQSREARKTEQNIDMAEDAVKNVAIEISPGQVQSEVAGKAYQNIDMVSRCGDSDAKNVTIEKSPEQAHQQAGNQSSHSKLGSPGHRQSQQAGSTDPIIDMDVTPSGNAAKRGVVQKLPSFSNSRKVDNQSTPDKVSAASYTINSCKKIQSNAANDTSKKMQSTPESDNNGIISSKRQKMVHSTPERVDMPLQTCEKLNTTEAVKTKTPVAPIACHARTMATRMLTETDGQYDIATQTTEGQGANVGEYKDHPRDLNPGQEQLKYVMEINGSRNQFTVEGSSHFPSNGIDVEQYEVVGLHKTQVPTRPMKLRIRPLRQKDVEHDGIIRGQQAPVTSAEAHSKGPEQATPSEEIPNFVVQIQREDTTEEINMGGASSNHPCHALEDESFPFIKCSPVWKVVDSLEVFHVMPQTLHFRSLEQLDMDLREGYAIGSMLNFANIVENVGKSKLDDPVSILQKRSKNLTDLKAHGFNVQPIQARLETLLKIKEEQAKLNYELMEAENRISVILEEKITDDTKLDEHNQKIRNLQECLKHLMKKQDAILLKKKVQDASIAELQKTMGTLRECINSVTSEFRTVVATPW